MVARWSLSLFLLPSLAMGQTTTVTLGGDVLLGRGVAGRAKKVGWGRLLGKVAPRLKKADLAIVNLESPLAPCLAGGTVNRPRLCGDPRGVAALAAAGIDAVNLANNHALDAGPRGLASTARLLARAKVASLGRGAALDGRPGAERLGDILVVAASLTPAALPPGARVKIPTPASLARAIRSQRGRRPVLVLLHSGRELDRQASPREGRYVKAAVRAGAAAVVMHGAHVIRRLYIDKGVPVHLGLGNLLFDQRDPRTRRGVLLTLELERGRPARVKEVVCVDPRDASIASCPKGIR
jgi:poly-gamma-glutamate synthesis protein (capsule biosynthesis protein)